MIQWQNAENVIINNISTSSILEDASDVLNYFADKYIITKYPLSTGDLVEYAGIKYIVVSQIDRNIENRKEEQYNYRARIRQADYKIKIVIDGKVEEIYTIIEGQKFSIVEGQFFNFADDKIIVTLQADEIASQITKNMRFIKLDNVWKIVGIDKTRMGLITLFCDVNTFSNNDDIENEIADSHLIEDNNDDPEPEPGDYRIELNLSYNEVIFNTFETCNVKVYLDNEEVDDEVTFEIIGDNTILWLENVQSRQCSIKAGSKLGSVILRVSLKDDENIYEEIEIKAVAW